MRTIEYEITSIDIKESIDRLKAYFKRKYFSNVTIEDFEEKIKFYLGSGSNQANYELRKLLKNNEVWLEHQGYFIK